MRSDNIDLEDLKIKLSSVRRSAWKPIVEERDGTLTASKFGGKPWLNAGESWPICPNCHKPMQFFLQLNLHELTLDKLQSCRDYIQLTLPLNLEEFSKSIETRFGKGILQLFYCTNNFIIEDKSELCEITCEGWLPFSISQFVRVIQPNQVLYSLEDMQIKDSFTPNLIVGWEEIDDYPGEEEIKLNGITLDGNELNLLWDREFIPFGGDKLAGWPRWIHDGVEYPDCPICKQKMDSLIFQVSSEVNIPYMWGDAGTGYLLQCPEHKKQVAFLWQS